MIWQNVRIAIASIGQHKLRAFLTILGIVIGVGSVVSVIAVGAGLKNSITDQVESFGTNLLQVTPGQAFGTDEEGEQSGFNFTAGLGVSTLTEADVETVAKTENVKLAAPFTLISGVPVSGDKKAPSALIVATTPDLYEVLRQSQSIGQGTFLTSTQGYQAVIGHGVAEKLFGSAEALGKTISIRNKDFTIIGVMAEPENQGFNFGPSFGDMIFIPFETGKVLNNNVANIMEIDAQVHDAGKIDDTKSQIKESLKRNHGGEEDFTVATPEEQLKIFDQILNGVTGFIAAIAAISLLVGGIGIMNIMLVAVTERTREIGIRKAIGAARGHILIQFLTEAVVLSLLGGLLGVALAYGIGLVVRATIEITPVFSPGALLLAVGISTFVGVVFGITPALKAARKHPVEALRYE